LHLLLKTALGFKVFSVEKIQPLLQYLQLSLLPSIHKELLLISVLLMPKLPLAFSHSTRTQASVAVMYLVDTKNLV
jgi:hypothetical protein